MKLSYTMEKINSKSIKIYNYKTLRRKQGKFYAIGFGNDVLDITPKAQATKAITGEFDYIKI